MEQKKMYLIGNAHLDPVWFWRFGDGLAEIKATFRSALDRIRDFDCFIFTSACAFYYQWVEENCPEMFEEIRQAVHAGRWRLVGGMWVQPDCNMPATESLARHFLYSQHYFWEKFGVIAKTGYNVDSFGHTAAMPSLLRQGGMENYVYMRPSPDGEMDYPFSENAFRWTYGEDEVVAFRIQNAYCTDYVTEETLTWHEDYAKRLSTDYMMFYGVGNHGGGPTVRQIEKILEYIPHSENTYLFSHPDAYFDELRASDAFDALPTYRGELQNHASGCYAANSAVKKWNRRAENQLILAEKLASLAGACIGHVADLPAIQKAWKAVLFNQFHDVLCGCSIRAAYEDAMAYLGGATGEGMRQSQSAAQRISWSIDTSKGVTSLSKELQKKEGRHLWEMDGLGTPLVVFNPLTHAVKVPVFVCSYVSSSITDENDRPVPMQMIHAPFTFEDVERRGIRFLAEIEPLGWRTYWFYATKENKAEQNTCMLAREHCLKNDRIEVRFDEATGNLKSVKTIDGRSLLGKGGCRTVVMDDQAYDTWAHGAFTFDSVLGEFGNPQFVVEEAGDCQVSLLIRQTWRASMIEQIYTLYAGDDRIHVSARLVLNDPLVRIAACVDTDMEDGEWLREIPGGVINAAMNGREQPMLRYMAIKGGDRFFGIANDGKHSCAAEKGQLRMTLARSCHYADHTGVRFESFPLQDIGEQHFSYLLMPNARTLTDVLHGAEELNTEFLMIPETYHKGTLPQAASHWACDAENVTLLAWKQAEDGDGTIVRLCETEGMHTQCTARLMGRELSLTLSPYQIRTLRIEKNEVVPCNFLEWET